MKITSKTFAISLCVLATTLTAKARQACFGEARIEATVVAEEVVSGTSCLVSVTPASIQIYQANPSCPLSLGEILTQRIEVGVPLGEDECMYPMGRKLKGFVVKNQFGELIFESDASRSTIQTPAL